LLFQLNTIPMAYPEYHFVRPKVEEQCRLLCVADSYYWGLQNMGFSDQIARDGQFWFYNQIAYPESFKETCKVKSLDVKKVVESKNLIMVVSTEMTMNRFTYGFIDQLYAKYYH
jgi:hypothetical protein